jgi:hypothetical protein
LDLKIPETTEIIDRYGNTSALIYKVFGGYVCLFIFSLKCRYCEETIFPAMMEVDRSTQGTINQQMFYNRKTLREIIDLRYNDVKTNVSLSPSNSILCDFTIIYRLICYTWVKLGIYVHHKSKN